MDADTALNRLRNHGEPGDSGRCGHDRCREVDFLSAAIEAELKRLREENERLRRDRRDCPHCGSPGLGKFEAMP